MHGHIILEVVEVRSSHVGFHMTVSGIHRHEARAQEVLIVADRVHRCHHRVHRTIPSEDRHFLWSAEGLVYLGICSPCILHHTIAVRLLLGAVQNAIYLLL